MAIDSSSASRSSKNARVRVGFSGQVAEKHIHTSGLSDGVSVTSEIVDSDDPRGAARSLMEAMREAWATRPLLREAMVN